MTAFHDEIKPEKGKIPFLAHAILYVPEPWEPLLLKGLHDARSRHNYSGEIHWREIKAGDRSNKFRVAQDWIHFYLTTALKGCAFKAYLVEDGPNRSFPYPGELSYPNHLLLSTKSALKAGIAWSFNREDKVRLELVFDETDNEVERLVARQVPALLKRECNERRLAGTKAYPWIRPSVVRFVSSNPNRVTPDDYAACEFIQLCDLLLGASFQALGVLPEPDKAGRRKLASSIMEVLGETMHLPWLQQVPVHRKFSVSLYPDKFNFAYTAALRMGSVRQDFAQLRLRGF